MLVNTLAFDLPLQEAGGGARAHGGHGPAAAARLVQRQDAHGAGPCADGRGRAARREERDTYQDIVPFNQ